MADITEQFSKLLSSPEGMDKISQIISMLDTKEKNNINEEIYEDEDTYEEENNPLGGFDIDILLKIAPLMSQFGKNDENTALLYALKPHLKNERQKKVDTAAKLMQIVKVLPLLKDTGIL